MEVAFQEFVNKKAVKFTNVDLLPAYCDDLLKGCEAGQKLTKVEIGERLESVINLFKYFADKEMFFELYRHKLAKSWRSRWWLDSGGLVGRRPRPNSRA